MQWRIRSKRCCVEGRWIRFYRSLCGDEDSRIRIEAPIAIRYKSSPFSVSVLSSPSVLRCCLVHALRCCWQCESLRNRYQNPLYHSWFLNLNDESWFIFCCDSIGISLRDWRGEGLGCGGNDGWMKVLVAETEAEWILAQPIKASTWSFDGFVSELW